MAGIAQVWLTEKELDALLAAAPNMGKRVSDELWGDLGDKLLAAYKGVACQPAVAVHENPVLTPAQLQELASQRPSRQWPGSKADRRRAAA